MNIRARRLALNTNAKKLFASVLCGGAALVSSASAQTTVKPLTGNVVQRTDDSPSAKRKQVDGLLRQARTAMKQANVAQARSHLQAAEQIGANYNGLLSRFADTPEKVRRDLAQLEASVGAPTQRPKARPVGPPAGRPVPRQLANQLPARGQVAVTGQTPYGTPGNTIPQTNRAPGSSYQTIPADQFVGLNNAQDPAPVQFGPRVPSVSARPAGQLQNRRNNVAPPQVAGSPQKQQALKWLAEAQAALGRGDLGTAKRFADQAGALRVPDEQFLPNEPRP